MEVTKSVQLDLRKNTHKIIDIFKKWDKNSRSIEFEIIQDGEQLSIPEASCTAMIAMKKPDGEPIFNCCTIENNIIKVVFTEQMLASDGIANAELRIYDSSTDSLAITSSFKMLIRDSTIDDFKIQSSYEYNALTSIILSNAKAIKETQKATQNAIHATNTVNSTVEQMNQLSSSVSEAESARISAEEGRVSAENNRKSSETNRNLVFEEKIISINEKISAAEDATSAANEAAEKANTVASGDITSKTVTFTQGSEFALPESDETVGDIIGKTVGDLNDLNTRLRSTIEFMGSGVYVSDEIAEETTFDTTLDADTLNGQPSSYYATSEDVAALNSQIPRVLYGNLYSSAVLRCTTLGTAVEKSFADVDINNVNAIGVNVAIPDIGRHFCFLPKLSTDAGPRCCFSYLGTIDYYVYGYVEVDWKNKKIKFLIKSLKGWDISLIYVSDIFFFE